MLAKILDINPALFVVLSRLIHHPHSISLMRSLPSDMNSPTDLPSWKALEHLAKQGQPHLRDLLSDVSRSHRMQATAVGLELDFSRQRITDEVFNRLLTLCEESEVMSQVTSMFKGEAINTTEKRPVLHVALRGPADFRSPWGNEIAQKVIQERHRMLSLAQRIREGHLKGFSGSPITDVVNLGIGGSDLGPRMAAQALAPVVDFPPPVRVHFVSNVDAWSLHETLRELDPARTLFVIQSKTFTTQETMTLSASAMQWLIDAGCPEHELNRHRVAVTANPQLALAQGFTPENTLEFWEWVGGRYSVWSSIGFPLAIAVGAPSYEAFLAGAHEMDEHFRSSPLSHNLPVLLALCGIWNRNFLGAPTHHVAPYPYPLKALPSYLQQLEMESNGKRTHRDGQPAQVDTSPLVWGGLGIDGQHAYFQLIHQGTLLVPIDFIGVRTESTPMPLAARHHQVTCLNLQAQAQALAFGRTPKDTMEMLMKSGMTADQAKEEAPHRSYPGNIPSHLIWMQELNPKTLGALLAMYEHKVFCQAAIWRINAFDQWGVELGKIMARELENRIGSTH